MVRELYDGILYFLTQFLSYSCWLIVISEQDCCSFFNKLSTKNSITRFKTLNLLGMSIIIKTLPHFRHIIISVTKPNHPSISLLINTIIAMERESHYSNHTLQ